MTRDLTADEVSIYFRKYSGAAPDPSILLEGAHKMPIKFKLTREQWQTFKTESKVGNLPWYKQVDVGPSINNFWTALSAFDKDPSTKNMLAAQDKAKTLKSALAKFAVRKATASELSDNAWEKIQAWRKELDEVIDDGYLEKEYVRRRK